MYVKCKTENRQLEGQNVIIMPGNVVSISDGPRETRRKTEDAEGRKNGGGISGAR